MQVAIDCYTKAINADGSNHVYYSNRSAAYLKGNMKQQSLDDADACIGLNPNFAKGYSRKGAALHAMKRYNDAIAAYESGLSKFPTEASLVSGLADVKKEQSLPPGYSSGGGGGGGANPMAQLFGPSMQARMRTNEKLAPYLNDAAFVAKLNMLQRDPNTLQMMMGSDPRIMEVVQFALGERGGSMGGEDGEDDNASAPARSSASSSSSSGRSAAPAAPAKKTDLELFDEVSTADMDADEKDAHGKRRESLKRKSEGNDLYALKDFSGALSKYDEALALDPRNMTFVANKSAVYFTMKEWDLCIEHCTKVIEGKVSFEERAKALARAGKAHQKKGDIANAIEYLKKAQMEAFSSETDRLLKTLELEKRKADTLAYQNPELAEAAKNRGNDLFREQKYGPAVLEYEEAIKRAPRDAPIRNNLAAALCKVMDFNGAKKHIDVALEIDPKYVKAWARKGDIHFLAKEFHKALEAYQKGLDIDVTNSACKEGAQKTLKAINSASANLTDDEKEERRRRGMADPEIQCILTDPIIRQVLQDFQENPKAAQAAMKDASVSAKIEKLIAAGILQTK